MAKKNESEQTTPSTPEKAIQAPAPAPDLIQHQEQVSGTGHRMVGETDESLSKLFGIDLLGWVNVIHEDKSLGQVRATVPVSRLKTDDADIHGIRDGKSYNADDEDLVAIAKSMHRNGILRIATDVKAYFKPGANHLTVISGQRRITAAHNLLTAGVIKDQPIHCIIVSAGERSIAAGLDNAYRKQLTDIEKFREIVFMDKQAIHDSVISDAVGMSVETIRRYLSISRYPVLTAMLNDDMPYTRLSRIAETLKDKSQQTKDGTMQFLKHWHEVEAPKRRQKMKDDAARENKTLKSTALELSKLFRTGEYEGWIRDINADQVPTGKPKTPSVTAEIKNDMLKISGLSADLTKLTAYELGQAYAKYKSKVLKELLRAIEIVKLRTAQQDSGDSEEEELEILESLGMGDAPIDSTTEEEADNQTSDGDDDDDGGDDAGFDQDA